jgi:hypothetical protein
MIWLFIIAVVVWNLIALVKEVFEIIGLVLYKLFK